MIRGIRLVTSEIVHYKIKNPANGQGLERRSMERASRLRGLKLEAEVFDDGV